MNDSEMGLPGQIQQDNPVAQFLEAKAAEVRAGKIMALSIVWAYGVENGGYQIFGQTGFLTMEGLTREATDQWHLKAFPRTPMSPILRAIGDVPRA